MMTISRDIADSVVRLLQIVDKLADRIIALEKQVEEIKEK